MSTTIRNWDNRCSPHKLRPNIAITPNLGENPIRRGAIFVHKKTNDSKKAEELDEAETSDSENSVATVATLTSAAQYYWEHYTQP